MKNKFAEGIIAVQLVICMFFTIIPPVSAEDNTININNKKDFMKFARNCTLDTWSQGKIVNLNCNIDFSGNEFVPVPIFDGTFNGNGFTISGIIFDAKGSHQGVFRYIKQNGEVSNLNVKGKFIPGGSKSYIGGIAGENSGRIEKCFFKGTVKGENVIGGIVGNNTDYGKIISCASNGSITGENFTGGISGKNSGFIQNCTNNASVNTVFEEKKKSIADIDADTGAIIESYKNAEEENEEESVLGHSDTGGVAGYSTGIVQGCTNNAAIGYKHIGYNVGGIAGRQSGYMLGCMNYGFIQGRKDVGGIVGQAEPYIILNTSQSKLKDLKNELSELNSEVNRFLNDTDNLGDDIKQYLNGISTGTDTALDSAEIMINGGTDFINDNVSEINAQAAIISNTADKLTPVFESLEKGGDKLTDGLEEMSSALKNIEIYAPDLTDEIDNITSSMSYISLAEQSIRKAISKINRAKDDLYNAFVFNDAEAVENAVSKMIEAIEDIISAKQTIKNSGEEIRNILLSKSDDFGSVGINAMKIAENLKEVIENTGTVIISLKTINDSLKTIKGNTELDFYELKSAAQKMESAVNHLSNAMYYITHGLDDISDDIRSISDKLKDYTDDISEDLNTAKDRLGKSMDSLAYASENITDALSDMKNIISDLSNEETLEFVKLDDKFKNASDNLFDSLSEISGEFDGIKNTTEKSTIIGDLTDVSNRFDSVMNLLIGEIEDIKNGTRSISDMFLDVSDEDIKNTKQGKIEDCRNFGKVAADRNTGGIAGAAAIEYSKDPEDEIEKPDTLNFTYQTKTVLQSCVNNGETVGKKDCAGGIVGLLEIGTIYECENYGDVESSNGNYTGGIAGKSESSIRKSYAKSKLTGKRFVGGIAGKGDTVISSYAIVNVNGDENVGAVCGAVENDNSLHDNFFTDNGCGAVDGISRKGKAEPIEFENLKNIPGIPLKFISFTVTFIADDKIVENREVKYGTETARIEYPEIPDKKGYFGNWNKIDNKTVTENIEVICEYSPYITVISSDKKNKNGKLSVVLCKGKFDDKAKLSVADGTAKPPVKADDKVKVYDISVSGMEIKETDDVTLHLLSENKDKVKVWVLNDGEWESIKTVAKGKYVILRANGANNTVCLKYEEHNYIVILIIMIMICLCFIIFLKKYIKRRRKIESV